MPRDVQIDLDVRSLRNAVHDPSAAPVTGPVGHGPGETTLAVDDG